MKMIGKLGWHGQCACCCGKDGNQEIKRQEERQWRKEADDEIEDAR